MGVPGTILFPGEQVLPPPAAPPCLPVACWPAYDPVLGPRCLEGECFHDGGDVGLPAGIGPDRQLHGLDPSDTVAEYTNSKGQRRIAISNRVCLCAPRFAVLRVEVAPSGFHTVANLGAAENLLARVVLRERLKGIEYLQVAAPEAMLAPKKPSEAEVVEGVVRIDQFQEIIEARGRVGEIEVVGVCLPCPPPGKPLVLCKWADKHSARIGEIVTFYLKYTNQGGQPITGVVVSDSLTGRLEYVPGTALADRAAVFTTQENEAGSLILRWEIAGSLPPVQRGMLRFQARVR